MCATGCTPRLLVGFVYLIFLVFCVVFLLFCFWFVSHNLRTIEWLYTAAGKLPVGSFSMLLYSLELATNLLGIFHLPKDNINNY